MYPSELTEGRDDLVSRLTNLAFQLVLDGQRSQIASIRYDLCVEAGARSSLCDRIYNEALRLGEEFKEISSSRRFFYASSMSRTIVAAHRIR